MNGGVGVRLDPDSSVIAGDYFVSVDPRQDDRSRFREATVRIASTIEPEWLETFFPQSIHKLRTPVYDADRGRVVVKVETRYLDLVLREVVDLNIDKAEAPALLAAALQPLLPEMIEQSEPLSALIARLRFLKLHFPDRDWPTPEGNAWRELLIEACQGKQSREQVQRALVDTLRNRLAYPLDRLLDEHAPEAITVPTGSRINLAYNTDPKQPPVLAVRLQEMFGLPDTPRIAGGRVPVLLHLLGPNFRPVQVTQDLSSFWKNTYAQVRKDLRARYPKQSWPDDPLTADPIRGAKRRRPEG
jgi:ATP-dependent helicase HrpB